MTHEPLTGLASIVVLGISSQWLAWRLRLPAILLLLTAGFLVGPLPDLLGHPKLLNPEELLGSLLQPLVSLFVALILFEGGLSLNVRDVAHVGRVVRNLVTLGTLISWALVTPAAHYLLHMSWGLSLLFGAILTVTGPTVIGPLLRFVRPSGPAGAILRWEGIVIDPIGAMLALIVFEVIKAHSPQYASVLAITLVGKVVFFGAIFGLAASGILILLLRRFWVPDYLESPLTLMLVLAAFTAANLFQSESGLFAVTLMGLWLANQKLAPFRHILEFKETLSVLLISSLFIILGARLDASQLKTLGWSTLAFLGFLILIVRPASVMLCTAGSTLAWRDRLFLSAVAPRGVVAAAVSSVFALRLHEAQYPNAERLVPATFAVIIGTVIVYGLSAVAVARRLGLRKRGAGGFLIAGANPVARAIGKVLQNEGQGVLLVDTNHANIAAARLDGLPTLLASVTSEYILDKLDLSGIGRLLSLTPNEAVNALAAVHFARIFGRSGVYQLPPVAQPGTRQEKVHHELRARLLFSAGAGFAELLNLLNFGATIRKTTFTPEFDYARFRELHNDVPMPLFLIDELGDVNPVTADAQLAPRAGQSLLSIMIPSEAPR